MSENASCAACPAAAAALPSGDPAARAARRDTTSRRPAPRARCAGQGRQARCRSATTPVGRGARVARRHERADLRGRARRSRRAARHLRPRGRPGGTAAACLPDAARRPALIRRRSTPGGLRDGEQRTTAVGGGFAAAVRVRRDRPCRCRMTSSRRSRRPRPRGSAYPGDRGPSGHVHAADSRNVQRATHGEGPGRRCRPGPSGRRPQMLKPSARICSRPSGVIFSGPHGGIHTQLMRKPSTMPSRAGRRLVLDDVGQRAGRRRQRHVDDGACSSGR